MTVHFLADLHLQPARPALTRLFLDYCRGPARQAEAIYLLGDLFEYWIGDYGSLADYPQVIDALAALSSDGRRLYFMRGNRDFMVGNEFCARTGAEILPDPCVRRLGEREVLLSHGDLFCTDDVEHQQFRKRYTDPRWRRKILRFPVWVRRLIARYARAKSQRGKRGKSAAIMDVSPSTVDEVMSRQRCDWLIHGHTHRPADHVLARDGATGLRQVLADWDEFRGGEVLVVDDAGSHRLPIKPR